METLRRHRRIAAGSFALAMLLPAGALAIDSTPKQTFDRTGYVMPLPPIRHLDSMRWMDWKPSAPGVQGGYAAASGRHPTGHFPPSPGLRAEPVPRQLKPVEG
jgi:hypothetical protein